MRCLFVTNQVKTEFYEPLARAMEARGAEVFWISVSARWTRYLVDRGWPRDRILSLEDFGPEWERNAPPTEQDRLRCAKIEAMYTTTLKNVLIVDRELKKRSGRSVEGYIYVVSREIERFVVANDIVFGFGEDTWAPELLTWLVMAVLDRRYLIPHSMRIPSSRLLFFTTIFHFDFWRARDPDEKDLAMARRAIDDVRERGERPYYFASRNNPQRMRSHWFGEAAHHILHAGEGRFDHTVPSLWTRVRRRLAARRRVRQVESAAVFERPSVEGAGPFVFMPLHLQPEASVDVYGGALTNQLEIIRAMARLLPIDWQIWVKEHPHAIGNWPLQYYRELLRIPGVRLIHYDESSMAIMRRASLVASVSGTACMEAGIAGIPAITFAPIYFGDLLVRNGYDPFGSSPEEFRALLAEAEAFRQNYNPERAVQVLGEIVAQSFEGIVSDPVNAPGCIAPENIAFVADAFMNAMDGCRAASSRASNQSNPVIAQ